MNTLNKLSLAFFLVSFLAFSTAGVLIFNRHPTSLFEQVETARNKVVYKESVVKEAILKAVRTGQDSVQFEYDRKIVQYLIREGFPDNHIITQGRHITVFLGESG